jgi:hypothetical protein
MKKYAVAHQQVLPEYRVDRASPVRDWSRRNGQTFRDVMPPENQVVRGLVIGLPLALALWLMLAMLAWIAF